MRVSHSRRGRSRHPGRRRGAHRNPVIHHNWLQRALRGRPFLAPSPHLPIGIRFFVSFWKSMFFYRFSGCMRFSITIRSSWRPGQPPRRSRRTPSMRPVHKYLLILNFVKTKLFFCFFLRFLAHLQLSIGIRSALAPPGRSRAAPGGAPGRPGGAF